MIVGTGGKRVGRHRGLRQFGQDLGGWKGGRLSGAKEPETPKSTSVEDEEETDLDLDQLTFIT